MEAASSHNVINSADIKFPFFAKLVTTGDLNQPRTTPFLEAMRGT
jgi:hypothetical protein